MKAKLSISSSLYHYILRNWSVEGPIEWKTYSLLATRSCLVIVVIKRRSALHVLIFDQEYFVLILIEIGKVTLERVIKFEIINHTTHLIEILRWNWTHCQICNSQSIKKSNYDHGVKYCKIYNICSKYVFINIDKRDKR